MAEAFLQYLLEKLSILIQSEVGLIMGMDKEMKKLSSTLITIQAVLEDAEDKQLENKSIQIWLRRLNDLSYEIDDILDECTTESAKMEKKKTKKLSLKKIWFQRKIATRMKEMAEKLDVVGAEREKFHLREISIERQSSISARRETGSALNEPHDVYGRDKERNKIVDILVNDVSNYQQLSILPIIGVGGLGKTTLAQLVYNDKRIQEHFDLKLWVCVYDGFNLKSLIKAMIESATGTGSASDLMHLDALQRGVWELLNQKRYLLILDDVWNDDQEKWAMFKNILACGSRGASIIVTTRLKKVADIMGTLPTHCLGGLSEDHCWLLFKQRAFGFGQEKDKHPNLERIGRQIVKKCVGVPLAAKALGGLLRFKRKENEWIYVRESEMWNLPHEETSIMPALRLSYHHLPSVLRRCFAYCAVFPKDSIMEKENLILLWMAHGCISSNGMQQVEDVGDQVWNELVLRSLFQDVNTSSGKTTFKMHDLVHDLALSIMENKVPGTQMERQDTSATNSKIRQVTLSEHSVTFPSSIQVQVSTLTSLMNFNRLRMLNASWTSIKELPSAVGKLKHLRYLNLSSSSIRTLPKTICGLWNLQIVNLNECYDLVGLPKNMRYLNNLRHLFLESCRSLIHMPRKIGELTSLKTLSLFIVGHNIGNQLAELECLDLGGNLEIRHLERVKNHMDAKKANLREKSNLRDLVLRWGGGNASKSREMMDIMVLKALEPPPNIRTLRISGFRGRSFPLWMRSSNIENITHIILENCPNCSQFPPLGDLPRLKFMELTRLNIEYITEDEAQEGSPIKKKFSSLEELKLHHLPCLKGLFKEQVSEMFPKLQNLLIDVCPMFILPSLSSLKELKTWRCTRSTLSSLSKLENLTALSLNMDDTSTTCIPNETLEKVPNLKKLRIWDAHENCLAVEWLRGLKSLTELEIIYDRDTKTCLPEGWLQHLTALEQLCIYNCPELAELPDGVKYLHSLKSLRLDNLPKMVCLPKVLQQVRSLERLSLWDLPQLTLVPDWLGNFMYLELLSIHNCPRIASLPSTMQGMKNLQSLSIGGCPILKQRCEKGKGEDWHKIEHIANLHIS